MAIPAVVGMASVVGGGVLDMVFPNVTLPGASGVQFDLGEDCEIEGFNIIMKLEAEANKFDRMRTCTARIAITDEPADAVQGEALHVSKIIDLNPEFPAGGKPDP